MKIKTIIGEGTSAPINIPPRRAAINLAELEFIRLPPVGQPCPESFWLSRGALNEIILPSERNNYTPPVKSFCLRQRGARTGIRLIDRASLVQWIRANPAGPADSTKGRA